MLRSSLCDYSDDYILLNGIITIIGEGADDPAKQLDERKKGVISKNFTLSKDCISEINNTQMYNIYNGLDFVIPMHNLFEYSDND